MLRPGGASDRYTAWNGPQLPFQALPLPTLRDACMDRKSCRSFLPALGASCLQQIKFAWGYFKVYPLAEWMEKTYILSLNNFSLVVEKGHPTREDSQKVGGLRQHRERLKDRWKEMSLGHRVEGRGPGLWGRGVWGGDCGVGEEGGEA